MQLHAVMLVAARARLRRSDGIAYLTRHCARALAHTHTRPLKHSSQLHVIEMMLELTIFAVVLPQLFGHLLLYK